jgi:hypothetical protein
MSRPKISKHNLFPFQVNAKGIDYKLEMVSPITADSGNTFTCRRNERGGEILEPLKLLASPAFTACFFQ